MKPQWMLLWALLLSVGIGVRAEIDLDNILDDDNAEAGDAVEAVVDEDADAAEAEVEEIDADLEDAEVAAPQPAAVPEPTVAAPVATPQPAATEDEEPSIGHRLAMWLPNRLVDLDDIISGGVGAGSKFCFEPRVTRYFQFGGSYGDQYFVAKGYNRQLGGGFESGWGMGYLCWSREKRYVEDTFGLVHPYLHYQPTCSIPSYDMAIYQDNKRDLWDIGIDAGWMLSINLFVHPVEIADFLTGIFLYDLSKDDF